MMRGLPEFIAKNRIALTSLATLLLYALVQGVEHLQKGPEWRIRINVLVSARSSWSSTGNRHTDSEHESDDGTRNGCNAGAKECIPLPTLAGSSKAINMTCPEGFIAMQDTILPRSITHPPGRLVPRIVHITSKDRCVSQPINDHLKKWHLANHSFYFHDDQAMITLMNQSWLDDTFRTGRWPNEKPRCTIEPSFEPNVTAREVFKCATAGAIRADLWRYVVLYRYGGIYTDLDNTPTGFKADTIKEHDDSFFVLEQLGIVAQYFLASSPAHPYMRYTMDDALDHLRQTRNVMKVNAPRTTGPGAIKRGLCLFLEAAGKDGGTGYITAGRYVGAENRSVTIVGNKNFSKQYIDRGGLGPAKMKYYREANIAHFSSQRSYPFHPTAVGCNEHVMRTRERGDLGKVASYKFSREDGRYIEAGKGFEQMF
mmetsp:Transcript_73187/g.203002  ORF Transcript_73187/g.203002 Transcript_73187/m.203002 type:complete len:427 (-) Transcript_73187:361-1641(-)